MYNILVFGLEKQYDALTKTFEFLPCKFIHIHSATEFYSIAFSRIFDLWIIDSLHEELPEINLSELLVGRRTPYTFLCFKCIGHISSEKVSIIKEDELQDCAEYFDKLMHNKQERNKEKYLAGFFQGQPGLDTIITNSPLMEDLFDIVKDIAPTDSPVLIEGETGTGKELLASIFHNESRRRSGPFMAVNCGALPDSLLESELFGYEKGAFTGADKQRIGKIEHASGGTLFLDEIEAMSPAMQVRLLRVLQEKTLQRLGGNTEIHTDFRVISATNTDPMELLSTGKLRSDLYYRLSVFQIHLPPLRDRAEDIPLLVQHFVNKIRRNGREYVRRLDEQAMKILVSVPWFGNIRELQNVIERAVMLADRDIITADLIHIPNQMITEAALETTNMADMAFRPGTTLKSYKNLLHQTAERKYLVELLEYTDGKIGDSAQLAGLTPRALYNKMKIHGLKKEDFKNRKTLE